MTTNMQVLQTSVLLKYKTLYEFLQNHAEDVAKEVVLVGRREDSFTSASSETGAA